MQVNTPYMLWEKVWDEKNLSHCALSSLSSFSSPLKVAFSASSMAATGSSGSSRSFCRLASNTRGRPLGATSSPQGLKTCCCKASQPKTKIARNDPMLYFTQVTNFVGEEERAMNLATHREIGRRHNGCVLEDLQSFSGEPRHEALNVTGAWDKLTMTLLLNYDAKY